MRILVALLLFAAPVVGLAQASVTLDGSTTYQTIDGFGCNLKGDDTNRTAPVLNALVDAGLTLFRVIQDEQNYIPAPGDHSVYNTAYFSNLVGTISYLNQLGITNGIHLNFMGGGQPWMVTGSGQSTFLALGQEDGWADMIGSLVAYLRITNHLQFNLVEPENESDVTPGTQNKPRIQEPPSGGATGHAAAYHALANYLNGNGLSDMRIVGLSTGYLQTDWINSLMSDSLVRSKVTHIALHSYADDLSGSANIGSFLQSNYRGTNFWMTEYSHWCTTCEGGGSPNPSWGFALTTANDLINHLANGAAACEIFTGCDTWMRYLSGGAGGWSLWGMYGFDDINAAFKTYSPRYTYYTLAQVSKYVKPGASRIGVSGSTSPFNMVAFFHPVSGQLILAGVNPSGAAQLSANLASLPAISNLELYYTSSSASLADGGAVPVTSGAFSANIPGGCVFTLVGQTAVSVALTNLADGATYSSPAALLLQANATTGIGSIRSVGFFDGATKLGAADAPPYNLLWTNVPPGVHLLTVTATNSVGNIAVSGGVHITVIGPPASIRLTPTNVMVAQYGQTQFTATVVDSLGVALISQPIVSWGVGGGGTIDSNGLFNAYGVPGGPFIVTAAVGNISASTSLNIISNGLPFLPNQTSRVIQVQTVMVVTNTAIADPYVAQLGTNSWYFNYTNRDALLADNWSFVATRPNGGGSRDTEITNPANGALVSYDQVGHSGALRIPCDVGDLFQTGPYENNTRNSLFRSLPTNWLSAQLRLSFAPAPSANYQQVHLGLYQDDDNYVQVGCAYHSDTGLRMNMTVESGGIAASLPAASAPGTLFFYQLTRNPSTGVIAGLGSADGINWTTLGTSNLSLASPRLMIWTGSYQVPYGAGAPNCDLSILTIISSNSVPRTLSYRLLDPPAGASIDTNGVITWTPAADQGPGTNVITTVVTDNSTPPLSFTNSFSVVIIPPPQFHILSLNASNDSTSVAWESIPGRTYRLQSKANLTDANWQDIFPDILATTTATTATNITSSQTSGFYRVLLLP